MRVLGQALAYFALGFGAGFLLGFPRVLLLAPRLGERAAELIEAPMMLLAIVLAARWTDRRFPGGSTYRGRLATGLIAAGLVLAADLLVGVVLRGMTLAQVLFRRDPVSGAVYYALIALFAAMPWLLAVRVRADAAPGSPR